MVSSSVVVAPTPTDEPSPPSPLADVHDRRRDRWAAGAVAAVALAAYVRTLLPGIGFSGDTAKWQMLSKVGGIPHATGYPLYLGLIQGFESVVPLRTAAWRTNLFSALCAAAAVAVLYCLVRRLGVRWEVAAATALTFAFTTAFWAQAVVAEVYALHILFLVLIMTCLAHWRLGASRTGDGWLLATLLLVALSFGNHLTTVLVLPGVAWVLWSDRQRLNLRHVRWVVGAGVLAAGQYLYLIYLADVGAYVESQVDDLGDIVAMVTGGPFREQMLSFTPLELLRDRAPMLVEHLRDEFRILLIPIVVGLVQSFRRTGRAAGSRGRRDVLVAVALLGLGSAAYGLNFDVLDVIVFFLPLFLALAVFLAVGLDEIVRWVGACLPDSRRAVVGVTGAVVAIPLLTAVVGYPDASQRGAVGHQQRIERVLAGAGKHAVLLTDNYQDSEFLWYYLLAEGVGEPRDLDLVNEATPGMVEEHFRQGTGRVAVIAHRMDGTRHPALLAITRDLAEEMADAGLTVTPHGPELWRVDRP